MKQGEWINQKSIIIIQTLFKESNLEILKSLNFFNLRLFIFQASQEQQLLNNSRLIQFPYFKEIICKKSPII
ncbi:unnamed protein product [Paramecium pentaurelia]|uniref:Uncharacterized protein n=1 Tax=Paramecium pentaurelia TaxID=43138 RepID=A0A8S1VBT5_9CILI|nr:unnamed protein product [Paramecium pentaurelia]